MNISVAKALVPMRPGDVRQRRFEELPTASPDNVQALADDHPAIVLGVPLFESTVVQAGEADRVLVSGENSRKIGRVITKGDWRSKPIFTLTLPERTTCPRACLRYRDCYGNAMPFARRHAPGLDLEAAIERDLALLMSQYRQGIVVRLHVLGDFYSVGYVQFWARMLEQFPHLCVYGYTALGASPEDADMLIAIEVEQLNDAFPERACIRWSGDDLIPGAAVVIDRLPESARVREGVVCPAEREATACCATCGLCWDKNFRDQVIVFVRHGMGSKRSERIAHEAGRVGTDKLRRVAAIANLAKLASAAENNPPTMMWVDPAELYVDETYQRNLSRKSIQLISRIVQHWNWTHFKPPIVVKDEDSDRLYALDGQHTAIAAATHPAIDKIPIMVVDAETVSDRAKAFIGHNRDRIAVTVTQLHHSSLVAGDVEAQQIESVCQAAGVKILRLSPPRGVFAVGETLAISGVRGLLRKFGEQKAKAVLSTLVEAKRAPVRADEMKAVAALLFGQAPMSQLAVLDAVSRITYDEAARRSRDLAASAGLSLSESLAAVYAQMVKVAA